VKIREGKLNEMEVVFACLVREHPAAFPKLVIAFDDGEAVEWPVGSGSNAEVFDRHQLGIARRADILINEEVPRGDTTKTEDRGAASDPRSGSARKRSRGTKKGTGPSKKKDAQ